MKNRDNISEAASTRLNELLENKKLRAADLSKMTGIHRATISGFLNGKRIPSEKNAQLLAEALNVDADFLRGHKDDAFEELIDIYKTLNDEQRRKLLKQARKIKNS